MQEDNIIALGALLLYVMQKERESEGKGFYLYLLDDDIDSINSYLISCGISELTIDNYMHLPKKTSYVERFFGWIRLRLFTFFGA